MSQNERRARLDTAVRDRLLAEVARLDAPAQPDEQAAQVVTAQDNAAAEPDGMPVAPPSRVDATLVDDEIPPLPDLPPDVARLAAAFAAPPRPAAPPAARAERKVGAAAPSLEEAEVPPTPETPSVAARATQIRLAEVIAETPVTPVAPVIEPPAVSPPEPVAQSDVAVPTEPPDLPAAIEPPEPVQPRAPVRHAARTTRPAAPPLVLRQDQPQIVPSPQQANEAAWTALGLIALDEDVLDRSLVITAARKDPAHGAFDVLRTRLLGALAEHGWTRVGITSPTKGCGKSFTAMNLAVALSRYDGRRTMLMDMDMRMPSLARSLGMSNPGSLGDVLRGLTPPAAHLRRVAPNRLHIGHLALGLNGQPEAFAAELFQEPRTTEVLAALQAQYRPDVILFDLPPALAQDDVIAFRPHFDCILMVIGGGMTSAREVRESIRRLGEDKPVVGIVLNRAEGEGVGEYAY